ASTSRPESSAMAGRPVWRQALRALMRAFSTKVGAVSSASVTLNSDCGTTRMPSSASTAATSRVLPALLLANTTSSIGLVLQHLALDFQQLGNALAGQFRHAVELVQPESVAFGGALELDEGAGVVHHHVHVGLGFGVFLIVQVQHRLAAINADRDCGDLAMQRRIGNQALPFQVAHGIPQRDEAASNSGGAGAAVGLQHVAIDDDAPLAQRLQIDGGAQRATD